MLALPQSFLATAMTGLLLQRSTRLVVLRGAPRKISHASKFVDLAQAQGIVDRAMKEARGI
jgi:hypothetical protein